jgi:methylphosphotriester-DNA--protein-cysteine methyltransferase
MFITEQEMQRRLSSEKNLVNLFASAKNLVEHKNMHVYTPPASKVEKIIAASLVAQGESVKDVVAATGLSPKQIASEKHAPEVKKTVDRVKELALEKTLIALGLMTQEKFENANLKDLAVAASSTAKVYERISERENASSVQFIIHAPQVKNLSQYKVIDV